MGSHCQSPGRTRRDPIARLLPLVRRAVAAPAHLCRRLRPLRPSRFAGGKRKKQNDLEPKRGLPTNIGYCGVGFQCPTFAGHGGAAVRGGVLALAVDRCAAGQAEGKPALADQCRGVGWDARRACARLLAPWYSPDWTVSVGNLIKKPATAVCPRTGSRVFISDGLLDSSGPVEILCPICDRWHTWEPGLQVLLDLDQRTDAPVAGRRRTPSS